MGFRVKDQFRSNDLSLVPGGSIVRVYFKDGRVIDYDKVKNVAAYCRTIRKNPQVAKIEIV